VKEKCLESGITERLMDGESRDDERDKVKCAKKVNQEETCEEEVDEINPEVDSKDEVICVTQRTILRDERVGGRARVTTDRGTLILLWLKFSIFSLVEFCKSRSQS